MFEDKIKQFLTKIPHSPENPDLSDTFLIKINEQLEFDIAHGIDAQVATANIITLLQELDKLVDQAANSKNSATMLKQLEKSIVQILELKSVNELQISLANIAELHFNYRIGDLIILPTTGDQLIVKDLMSRNITKLYSCVEKVGNVVKITQGPRKLVGIFKNKVLLFIPTKYQGFLTVRSQAGKVTLTGLKSDCMLDLTNISGHVLLSNLKVKRFQADLKSSNLLITHCQSQDLHINSHSGTIKCEALTTSGDQGIQITASSGNIGLQDATSKIVQITSKSGNLHLDNIVAQTEINTSSGNIKFKNISHKTDLATNSGSCKLSLSPSFKSDLVVNDSVGNIDIELPNNNFAMRFSAQTKLGPINLPMDSIIYANDDFNVMRGYLIDENAPAMADLKNEMGSIDIKNSK